jgi:tRNA nucleotidyltransferase (CCA-adding enzyme)
MRGARNSMLHSSVPAGAIPEAVVALCRRIRDGGHRAWVVGGSLRDVLMDRPPGDWDVATSATPEQVRALFPRVVPTGEKHGTVTVLWHGAAYEVTTLRGEGGYSDGRRPDRVAFIDDIESDLARRDFTVNAIAYDPFDDRLIDPFGGLADLGARVLRTVGRAEDRFREDGLRPLRAARFAATLEFELEPATQEAIRTTLDVFAKVSAERVRDEWLKAMTARVPSSAFEVMRETGLLAVTCPELVEQVGCEQNRYHAYDVWTHSLRCLDACPADPVERMAGLLHDLGKPRTRERSSTHGDWTFYRHDSVGAEMADRWLRAFRFANDARERIVHLVRHHLVCYADDWSDAAVRRFVRRVGLPAVEPLLALARADALAKGRPVEDELEGLERLRERVARAVEAGAAFGLKDLAVKGSDVIARLGVAPGPLVGKVLAGILERVIEDPALNERDALLRLADEIGGEQSDAGPREGEGP